MRKDHLQNRIAGSVFTLPVCAILALAVWWLSSGGFSWDGVWGLVVTALTAYVLLEMNNRFQLIRIRTRMMSSAWLFITAFTASMHTLHDGMMAALMLAVAHCCLLSTYEKHEPVGHSFYAALFLGVGLLFVPWLLFLLPFFLLHQALYLRSLTFRCLFATLLGALFPTFVLMVPDLFAGDLSALTEWWARLTDFQPITAVAYRSLPLPEILSCLLPFLLILLGGLHFLCTSYNDKISVRMALYILLVHGLVIQLLALFQPQCATLLFPSMLVCGVPFIAHFFALTRSWFTNFLFLLSLMLWLCGYVVLWLYG